MLTRGINFSAEETAFNQATELLYGKVRIGTKALRFFRMLLCVLNCMKSGSARAPTFRIS